MGTAGREGPRDTCMDGSRGPRERFAEDGRGLNVTKCYILLRFGVFLR
jgi:hypothetical protein